MLKFIYIFISLLVFYLFSFNKVLGSEKKDHYACLPKHAAAIRSNGIQVFKMKGDEKSVDVSIKDGYFKANGMSYKLYEAGGRATAFNQEQAWVHFQDITVLDDGTLSFVMAVNSSISRYLCEKK